MDRQRNTLLARALILLLWLAVAIYIAGYFAASEVRQTPVSDIRVFDSETIYDIYTPLRAIDERVTGRPTGFSD